MAKVTYFQPDGTARTCVNFEGMTVMHLAVGNLVDGIDALCGGVRQCGTCHCYIAPEWWDRVGPPNNWRQLAGPPRSHRDSPRESP